jgi:hypothetical protein
LAPDLGDQVADARQQPLATNCGAVFASAVVGKRPGALHKGMTVQQYVNAID